MDGGVQIGVLGHDLGQQVTIGDVAFVEDPIRTNARGPVNNESSTIGVCPACSSALQVVDPM